ncbi:hypothetical protein [Nonomuraea sp. NPDC049480]
MLAVGALTGAAECGAQVDEGAGVFERGLGPFQRGGRRTVIFSRRPGLG